jgi:predicted acetyltransferase
VIVRPLESGEEEAVAKVAHAAFRVGVAAPGESDHAHWLRYYTENPHVKNGETIVAIDGGKILGAVTALQFEMWLGNVDVPMRGFAAVVVAPDARRRNIAGTLMRETLARLVRRGDPIAMLRPFNRSFYRKFGFGSCELIDVVRVPPSFLPDSTHRQRVRAFDATKDFSELARIYETARTKNSRGAGALKRTRYWWEKRVLRSHPDVVVFDDGELSGYAIYSVPTEPAFPFQECRVMEIVSTNANAYEGLVGFFRALGEQYRIVDLSLPRSQSATLVLDHESLANDAAHRETIGFLHPMNMARLLDVPKALALHPLAARRNVRGEISLQIHDPLENEPISYDVTFDGRASAKLGDENSDRIFLRAEQLAQIYFGAARATDLLARGFIAGSAQAAEILDEAFFGLELFGGGPANHF